MTMAREAGANCVVTACPVCMANLDTRAGENVKLPVFYFTELMALAMGVAGTGGLVQTPYGRPYTAHEWFGADVKKLGRLKDTMEKRFGQKR